MKSGGEQTLGGDRLPDMAQRRLGLRGMPKSSLSHMHIRISNIAPRHLSLSMNLCLVPM